MQEMLINNGRVEELHGAHSETRTVTRRGRKMELWVMIVRERRLARANLQQRRYVCVSHGDSVGGAGGGCGCCW